MKKIIFYILMIASLGCAGQKKISEETIYTPHGLEPNLWYRVAKPVGGGWYNFRISHQALYTWIDSLIGSGTGLTNLNGLIGASQTFAVGTSGNHFTISSSGTTHTWYIPLATIHKQGLIDSLDFGRIDSSVRRPAGEVPYGNGARLVSDPYHKYDGNSFLLLGAGGTFGLYGASQGIAHGFDISLAQGVGTPYLWQDSSRYTNYLGVGSTLIGVKGSKIQAAGLTSYSHTGDSILVINLADSSIGYQYQGALASMNTVPNANLVNSTITINGASVALGGTQRDTISLGVIFDGGGSVIDTGVTYYIRVPESCTINKATMLSDVSTTSTVQVWVDTYANYPPVLADKIYNATPPTVTAALKSEDATLSGWSTSLPQGSVVAFHLSSNNNAKIITIQLDAVK
jgi:hypothetical protein